MQENTLQCDCRLAWLIRLRSRTASAHVRASLESTMCHMPRAAVPERLGGPGSGSGLATVPELDGEEPAALLPVKLVDLKLSELPCDRPLAEEPVTEEVPRPAPQLQKTPEVLSSPPQPARSSLTTGAPPPPQSADSTAEVKLGGVGAGLGGGGDSAASPVSVSGGLLLPLVVAAVAAR
ncbi:hypothetical protein FJT64_009955 [Amphibalanus amphitrite]|uniref:Connectin n=1 Tax=Amphibalanus amphitrite TaxID=1232801 RepID=A0A6A4VFT3_AMPAM|nr:hypothetical protein FJT64_009955 [Amphibalanus amphitrite]